MNQNSVSQDDITDVFEMTHKLENSISRILKDNQTSLAISALMSASINTILNQCDTLNEVIFCRNIFMDAFDSAIKNITIKSKKKKF